MQINKDTVVQIHYTLRNQGGDILDSSQGMEPLAYIQGYGQIIPGLETALLGKKQGDKLDAVIPPEEAYGPRHVELVQQVPYDVFPKDHKVQVGEQFQVQLPEGVQLAIVTQLGIENVTVDMNHPLAGETLHFEVEVGELRVATKDELEHGHVHGPDGAHHH